ncbi:hypothetical protein [Nocardia sp. NPDC050175]|uniref:hypothetical protein n=1 Tax=Nocardia sp. NPDC050175 TaxID=3364317 RepID=UPI003798C098
MSRHSSSTLGWARTGNRAHPTHNDADYLEQLTVVHDADHETGWDTEISAPPAERFRAALDAVDTTDRFEQSLITAIPDDDYSFAH